MPDTMELRTTLLDNWDERVLHLPPATSVAELKRAVLADARVRRPPDAYLVKYLGAELPEDGRGLAELGVPDGAALIVLRRRRAPVR